jgi:hypothetical protein
MAQCHNDPVPAADVKGLQKWPGETELTLSLLAAKISHVRQVLL